MSHKPNGIESSRKRKLGTQSPIIYIIVVGFHHKKGCQLEFVYPDNLQIKKNFDLNSPDSDLYTLPKKWRHLPSLALPDGSHNYESDYIYFHLEDDDDEESPTESDDVQSAKKSKTKQTPNRTIFGVSCFRQINASELINKDSEVTRNTLQKSVCILSTRPLYASIRLKLHSITCAYFEQKDFHKTQMLVNAFNTMSTSYESIVRSPSTQTQSSPNIVDPNEKSNYLIGLSLADLVTRYQHKILVLFKLLLLQKKCLFQIKPVSNLSNTIIALVSLMPDIFTARPDDVNKENNGLTFCSGFFDSIDVVNCELERKSKQKDVVLINHPDRRSPNDKKLNGSISSKKIKKKMKSFSKKKSANNSPIKNDSPTSTHAPSLTQTSNNTSPKSLAASVSSMSLKNQSDEAKTPQVSLKKETSSNKGSFLNVFSNNSQKFFSFGGDNGKGSNQRVSDADHEFDLGKTLIINQVKFIFIKINLCSIVS